MRQMFRTWQQRYVVWIVYDDGQPLLTALRGAPAGEVVEVVQLREAAHAAELVELWRGDPQLACLVALQDLRGCGPLKQ